MFAVWFSVGFCLFWFWGGVVVGWLVDLWAWFAWLVFFSCYIYWTSICCCNDIAMHYGFLVFCSEIHIMPSSDCLNFAENRTLSIWPFRGTQRFRCYKSKKRSHYWRQRAVCSIFPDLFARESSLQFNELKSLSGESEWDCLWSTVLWKWFQLASEKIYT